MTIDMLVREAFSNSLELYHLEDLKKELSLSLEIGKGINLDKTLLEIENFSQQPLPKIVYQLDENSDININELLKASYLQILNRVEAINKMFENIKKLMIDTLGVSCEGAMYQEPCFELIEINKKFKLLEENFVYYFSKLLKIPPPKSLLENKIRN